MKIADGTVISMPDTRANQAEYPQQKRQTPGVGFPLARLVALLSLSCGAVLDLARAPYHAKEKGETALFRSLWDRLEPGDVTLGDRFYGSYFHISLLRRRVVDCVFRLHQRRRVDFRCGERLGKDDHVVTGPKPQRPDWLDPETYRALPETLTIREVRVRILQKGFRTRQLIVVTTLLDPSEITAHDLAELYRARWHAELDLRTLKTTMQMDILRCRTPEMVRKEIWAHLLAYNLLRTVMAQAALQHGLLPRTLSPKGALQTLDAFRDILLFARPRQLPELCRHLLTASATHRVADRPDRLEPRARKRRAKNYPLLQIPRQQARRQLNRRTSSCA